MKEWHKRQKRKNNMAIINNPNQPDYTGASAQQYIDSYTNRPEDAGSLEGLQNLLGGVGMIPGVGEPADLLNALIYGAQGEGGQAGLSLLSMLPFVGGAIKPGRKAIKETAEQMAKRKKYWGRKAYNEGKYSQTKEQKYFDDIAEQEYQDALFQGVPSGEGGSFFEKYLRGLFD